ncbi:MAG: TusE/DsrC/DsvC family sulfur relay protein [Spirochaetia bacterium]|nr:TusE/DsrC/DsvC family sulfur relay protein [Spirochaetia bacterium]
MTSGVYNEVSIEVDQREIFLVDDGYMRDRELWSEEVAEALAAREGIVLTDEHWELLRYLRSYYEEYLISPNVKILVKHLRQVSGAETDTKKLYELFPRGPSFQGCKIAGLPKPTNCIDG